MSIEDDFIKEFRLHFKEDAEDVLTAMNEMMSRSGFVTVGDFHALIGVPSTYQANKVGWRDLSSAKVIEVPDVREISPLYVFDMPPVEKLVNA